MSRLFNGTTDLMSYAIPASSGGTGPNITFGTFLVVVRILQADSSWMSFIEKENSAAGIHAALGRHSNNSIYCTDGAATSENSAQTITSADNWAVYCWTKATGSVLPVLIKCVIGGSVASVNGGTLIGNFSDSSGGNMRLGGNDDFANIRLGVAAAFQGISLSTANVQSIADTKTTAAINALGATWLVDDSDAFATDLTAGTVDRTAISGTTNDADNPSGWVYGLGGAVAPVAFSVPARIPNRMVGPMALRYLFRQPVPQTFSGQIFALDMTADNVVVTASLAKQVNKPLTATTVAVTASVIKQVNKALTATSSVVTATLTKSVGKSLTATAVVVTASLARAITRVLALTATAVVVSASMVRSTGKVLSATPVVVTAALARSIGKLMTATAVAVTATVTKKVNKTLTATASVVTATLSATFQAGGAAVTAVRNLLGVGR
jgi:hypothetical protein